MHTGMSFFFLDLGLLLSNTCLSPIGPSNLIGLWLARQEQELYLFLIIFYWINKSMRCERNQHFSAKRCRNMGINSRNAIHRLLKTSYQSTMCPDEK